MSDIAIRVEGLGKRVRIGAPTEKYRTLRDSIVQTATLPGRALRRFVRREPRPSTGEDFWALKDVSFEVPRGEVVGIIGRNGAGKSTLLRVLSRITEPTTGYATIHGRVGSLLEVGTGFHPELSGRENIYLNGAILGMQRSEVRTKFDEIVAFAEVAKFIDTPVKHYSSGMYLRLAFAVAAHLEPEILLVDEVLAVGDAAFQRKCLQKMEDVGKAGRTVLFVSHNMAAVAALCSTGVLLQDGQVKAQGPIESVISRYLARENQTDDLTQLTERGGSGPIRVTGIRVRDQFGRQADVVQSGQPLAIELTYGGPGSYTPSGPLIFHLFFSSMTGERLFVCSTKWTSAAPVRLAANGSVVCSIPKLPLSPGQYLLDIKCKADRDTLDDIWSAKTLTVIAGDFFGNGDLPPSSAGPFLVEHSWSAPESMVANLGS